MKYFRQRLSLLVILLLSSYWLFAQRTNSNAASFIQVKADNYSVPADRLSFSSTLGSNNQPVHSLSFYITLGDDPNVAGILASFQSPGFKDRAGKSLSVTTFDLKGQPLEEKLYSGYTVQELSLPQLDATSKTGLTILVKITANSMVLQNGSKAGPVLSKRSGIALTSNFRISIGTLPATRVTKISGLDFAPGNSAYRQFTIELMAIDGNPWNQWFLTGAAGVKKEQGKVELLAANLKDVLYTIPLSDVEIISYAAGTGTGARATVGLRTKTFSIK